MIPLCICLHVSDSCFLPDNPARLIASVRSNCVHEPQTDSSHLHAPPPSTFNLLPLSFISATDCICLLSC